MFDLITRKGCAACRWLKKGECTLGRGFCDNQKFGTEVKVELEPREDSLL